MKLGGLSNTRMENGEMEQAGGGGKKVVLALFARCCPMAMTRRGGQIFGGAESDIAPPNDNKLRLAPGRRKREKIEDPLTPDADGPMLNPLNSRLTSLRRTAQQGLEWIRGAFVGCKLIAPCFCLRRYHHRPFIAWSRISGTDGLSLSRDSRTFV